MFLGAARTAPKAVNNYKSRRDSIWHLAESRLFLYLFII